MVCNIDKSSWFNIFLIHHCFFVSFGNLSEHVSDLFIIFTLNLHRSWWPYSHCNIFIHIFTGWSSNLYVNLRQNWKTICISMWFDSLLLFLFWMCSKIWIYWAKRWISIHFAWKSRGWGSLVTSIETIIIINLVSVSSEVIWLFDCWNYFTVVFS